MKRLIAMLSLLGIAATLSGCFTPSGMNSEEQQRYAQDMATSALNELYKWQPEAKDVVEKSSGYVVYNTYAIDYFFLATENGWGVAVNNKTGEKTYLKDITVGLGPGLGVGVMKDILVFDNDIDFKEFATGAWGVNLKADAVARFSEEGTWDVAGAVNLANGARAYKIGSRGLIAEAIIDLQRSWVNHSLEK